MIRWRGAPRAPLILAVCVLAAGFFVPAYTQTAHKSTASASKPAASTKTPAAKKSATTQKKTARRKTRPRWQPAQGAPTPERYKEIQQALTTKGFFDGPASGVWDQTSVEALKRFQVAQNLEPSGKLDSMSLIALGLGPKHDTQSKLTPPPQDNLPKPSPQ